MKSYKRLTSNNLNEYDVEYDFCCDCKYFGEPCGCNRQGGSCSNYERFIETYNRLAELEDEIENGTLIPKYSVVKDCGFYCVCEVNAQDVYVLAQCKTEAEAQKKLEELTE